MNERLQQGTWLWFVAGLLFAVAGMMMEPRRPLNVAVGALFFAVGVVWRRRAR